MARTKKEDGKFIRVSPAAKGAISEHIATAWLLSNGYDVFRNVSPAGRADLLAVNWITDETIRVDVKSEGFCLQGKGKRRKGEVFEAMDRAASERDKLNQGFNIRYLVALNDGSCQWLDDMEAHANDNVQAHDVGTTHWRCKKTMQRFLMPGNELLDQDWFFFCHWLVRAYPDYIIPFSEQFVREVSEMGMRFRKPKIEHKQIVVLHKLHAHIHGKLKAAGQLEEISE